MSDESSTLIYDLFVEAKALPAAQRAAYLQSACEPDLCAEVMDLLSSGEQQLGFLDDAPAGRVSTAPQIVDSEETGSDLLRRGMQIGPYKVLAKIGEGGMGVVYAAEQAEPVQRRVALKLIKPGLNTKQFVARFEAERQALALMQHPNIAQVFDAGTLTSGVPFLVMELIEGTPITDYCDAQQLDVRSRLRLFTEACKAIQHAHNKGLIHRDIKPSNLLVADQDGTPTVKVIDFGVAKALSGGLADTTLHSGVFQMVGTPLYVSPEQISLRNSDVDTRSDVYSLGVVLYELLSGTLPIPREAVRNAGLEQLLNMVCHDDIPRVSRRLADAAVGDPTLLKQRQIHASEIVSDFARELDWIVDKTLRKMKQNRYQSPRELAADVNNFLNGNKVDACTYSWQYTLRKNLHRHRRALLLAGTACALLIIATTASVTLAFRAFRAERNAEKNRAVAEANARTLTELLYARDMVSAAQQFMSGDEDRLGNVLRRYHVTASAGPDLRGFEWFLLNSQQPVLRTTIQNTTHRIDALALSRDQRLLAVGDAVGKLMIRDAVTHRLVAETQTAHGEILDLAWLPDNHVVLCGSDGTVSVWTLAVSSPAARDASIPNSTAEATSVESVTTDSYSPRTIKTALWASYDHRLKLKHRVKIATEALCALTIDPTGSEIYVSARQETLHRINWPSCDVTLVSKALARRAEGLAFAREGLVVGTYDGTTQFLQCPDGVPAATFHSAAMGAVKDAAFCAASDVVAIAQIEGLVSIYDCLPLPRLRFSCPFPAVIQCVAISPDGRLLAAGDATGVIHLLPLSRARAGTSVGTEVISKGRIRSWRAHQGKIRRIAFCGNDSESGDLRILSAANTGTVVESRPFAGSRLQASARLSVTAAAFLDDHSLICTGERLTRLHLKSNSVGDIVSSGLAPLSPGTFWSGVRTAPAKSQALLVYDHRRLMSASFSDPGGITSASEVWNARPGEFAARWTSSPSMEHFAVVVEEATPRRHRIEIYQSGTRRPMTVLESKLARDMVFLQNDRLFAFVYNNDIVVVETASGRQLQRHSGHMDTIRDLESSPDGRLLLSVSDDRTMICWDLASGKRVWSGLAHHNRVAAVAIHPFLPTVATVGEDAVLRFWKRFPLRPEKGLQLAGEYHLDEGVVSQLTFSPNGRHLVIRHGHHRVSWLTADLAGVRPRSRP